VWGEDYSGRDEGGIYRRGSGGRNRHGGWGVRHRDDIRNGEICKGVRGGEGAGGVGGRKGERRWFGRREDCGGAWGGRAGARVGGEVRAW